MAKVTVKDTPTESVIKAANQLTYVTDGRNRKIGLRRLPFIEEFRIVESVGPERASNQVYMAMLNPVLCIAEIDGDKIEVPRTHAQIEALIQRAGQEGFAAALEWISATVTPDDRALEARIKNVGSTPA